MKNNEHAPKKQRELTDNMVKDKFPLELRLQQMKPNNKGYNYLFHYPYEGWDGTEYRVEIKYRDATTKFDITPSQENGCDIFGLVNKNGELWFLSNKEYMSNCEEHSFCNKGYKGKSKQLSIKKFKELATEDIFDIVEDNSIIDYGVLPI